MGNPDWIESLNRMFPGSNTPLEFENIKRLKEKTIEDWDFKPRIFKANGVETEFFSIGQLGRALGNRSPNTLRAWEKDGTIPPSPYKKKGVDGDKRGDRRYYSREQVEGMIRIASEEGVLWPRKGLRIQQTKFTPRVKELFFQLRSRL